MLGKLAGRPHRARGRRVAVPWSMHRPLGRRAARDTLGRRAARATHIKSGDALHRCSQVDTVHPPTVKRIADGVEFEVDGCTEVFHDGPIWVYRDHGRAKLVFVCFEEQPLAKLDLPFIMTHEVISHLTDILVKTVHKVAPEPAQLEGSEQSFDDRRDVIRHVSKLGNVLAV